MKQLVIGILAHVDAGKTTLSEAMLYLSGSIRKLGRVDKRDTFLDTYGQEKERGITIFSKQAELSVNDTQITLLDTPGHVDFSSEMERTLQVLDYCVLVISGSDGVQGHTLTLWRLLSHYRIPTFLFVNKMDQPGTDEAELLQELRGRLSEACVDFSVQRGEDFFESIALSDEKALNEFLETGKISQEHISRLIGERKLFPCFFGSALKLSGVEEFLEGLDCYTRRKEYPEEFGAKVFKITRDAQGNRLTHMKITGGSLKTKEVLSGRFREAVLEGSNIWQEKVNQIRVYSGDRFATPGEVKAGEICAVTGLGETWAGEGLGYEKETLYPELSPVMCYSILLPEGCDAAVMLPKFRQLEEEEPQLHIAWDEKNKEIKAKIMGQVQIEVYQKLINERFGISVEFGAGSVVYKETITDVVEGVGHFEPLRHYAEVHLLLEPGEVGSGLTFATDCSEDLLDKNWQRLILTHLEEKEHIGVLIGAPVTDMKITLKSGRAHQKHTEGGDFRQATYRALRQGLMKADSVLLEPYYEFSLEIPESAVGRAMTDLDRMHAEFGMENNCAGTTVLRGMAPMVLLQDYHKEVIAYTKGQGRLLCNMKGYYPCHNSEEIIEQSGYDPMADVENLSASVFCAHGAGFLVEWNRVQDFMHLESCMKEKMQSVSSQHIASKERTQWLGVDEIDEILSRATCANRKENRTGSRAGWKREHKSSGREESMEARTTTFSPRAKREEYLLVDGYNVIFAWEELKELAGRNLDSARGKLLDILCNYQAIRNCSLIAVFDAYRLEGHPTEIMDYHNIHVVFTKEAETADQYIEKFAHENSRKYDVTVATSDGLEQIIITGEGCRLISARELQEEITRVSREIMEDYRRNNRTEKNAFIHSLSQQAVKEINAFQDCYDEQ